MLIGMQARDTGQQVPHSGTGPAAAAAVAPVVGDHSYVMARPGPVASAVVVPVADGAVAVAPFAPGSPRPRSARRTTRGQCSAGSAGSPCRAPARSCRG